MIKHLLIICLLLLGSLGTVSAQEVATSEAGIASESAIVASESAIVEEEKEIRQDLTQTTTEVRSKLRRVLDENPAGDLGIHNFLRHGVDMAVEREVPANTVVLILLFPLVVAIVAAARHLVGIRGMGILTPAMLAISFVATGILVGVVLFLTILLVATGSRLLLKRLRLQYLPRMAFLLWIVSGGVFLVLLAASYLPWADLYKVGIFPILILMLLAETFIDLQQGRSQEDARDIIFQTFVLAILTSLIVGWDRVQIAVLLYPELIYFGVGVFDLFIGKYTGLRLLEYMMFRPLVKDQEEE